ncbi:hypothetical protein [Streptomyces sp. NPDC004014]
MDAGAGTAEGANPDGRGRSNRRSNKFQHGMYLTWIPTDGVVPETSYEDDYVQNPV